MFIMNGKQYFHASVQLIFLHIYYKDHTTLVGYTGKNRGHNSKKSKEKDSENWKC